MVDIDAKTVMALRKKTGAPMMDCKAALKETGGDEAKAIEVLRKKGLQTADARAGREAAEGMIFSYIHFNGKLGVMTEIACETDFVARNEEFQEFGKNVCLHVAAMNPLALNADEIDAETIENERRILVEQAAEQMAGKPQEVIDKAVDGRMKKFFAERCLMDQAWVHDDKKSVEEVQKELVGKIGENITIRRFVRLELGG